MFTLDVSTLIKDPDRDKFTYSLLVSGDTTTLSNYGISLILNNLYGTPTKSGVIGMITVRCTDVHGNYADAYISIVIKLYEPLIRSNVFTYQNVVINENQRFQFQLNDTLIPSTATNQVSSDSAHPRKILTDSRNTVSSI